MAEERITDIGPPNYKQFLPPVITANYGKWDYHEILRPGVMVHVGETGDKLFTVRAASPRLLAVTSIRQYLKWRLLCTWKQPYPVSASGISATSGTSARTGRVR